MIEAAAEDEHDAIQTMRACMGRASRLVLEGVEVPVKAYTVRWPDRFMDGRPEAQDMWRDAMGHLVAIEREAREFPQMTTSVPTDDDLCSRR